MLFDNWWGLARVVVAATGGYFGLLLLLRASGKRTLSRMNAFDFTVTVSLGAALAGLVTSKNMALAEGLLALAMLIGLQHAVAWGTLRWPILRRAVKADPTLLFYEGQYVWPALKRERVDPDEVLQSMRHQNVPGFENVQAIVLEPDGTFSFIRYNNEGTERILSNVRTTGTTRTDTRARHRRTT